jgi:hypothetical protein
MQARLIVLGAACLGLPMLAAAQDPQLRLPSFSSLRGTATESVNIDLGWLPLHMTAWLMPDDDPQSAEVRKMMQGLKTVQIRTYSFGSDFTYPQADIEQIRAQLSGPGWSPLVQVRKRADTGDGSRENVDIYVALEDQKVRGLVIIDCEPREFTIVNIVGTVDLGHLASLRRTFVHPQKGPAQLPTQAP